MVFDFDKPTERNLAEAVRTYALTSRFVIADISAPRCVPHELMAIVPNSPSIPVVPILREGETPYAMFNDLLAYPGVLPPARYRDDANLVSPLQTDVIASAESGRCRWICPIRPARTTNITARIFSNRRKLLRPTHQPIHRCHLPSLFISNKAVVRCRRWFDAGSRIQAAMG